MKRRPADLHKLLLPLSQKMSFLVFANRSKLCSKASLYSLETLRRWSIFNSIWKRRAHLK